MLCKNVRSVIVWKRSMQSLLLFTVVIFFLPSFEMAFIWHLDSSGEALSSLLAILNLDQVC